MTTDTQMLETCFEMTSRLSDMGYVTPNVYMSINWLSDKYTVMIDYKSGKNATLKTEFCGGETMDLAIQKADEFIANLPTTEQMQLQEFTSAVGRLIDQGRDIGVDIEYLNPLTSMMKKLSENVITDQRQPAPSDQEVNF